jgi:hypothetical protein
MVRMPVCAHLWHRLSFVRQTLLANSFSFLPVNVGSLEVPEWKLVSDLATARFLRHSDRESRLGMRLQDAVHKHDLKLETPFVCNPDMGITAVLQRCNSLPAPVLSNDNRELLGIVTPFDLV